MNPYDLLVLLNDSQLSGVTEGCSLRCNASSNSWVIERLDDDGGYLLIRPNSFGQIEFNLPLCYVKDELPEGALIPIMLMCDGLGGKLSLVKDDRDDISLCYSCVLSKGVEDKSSLYSAMALIRSEYYTCLDRISTMRKIARASGPLEGLMSLHKLDNMLGDDKKEGEE